MTGVHRGRIDPDAGGRTSLAGAPIRRILITRPEPGASDTAARLAALGFVPVRAPMLTVRPLAAAWPEPDRVQAVIAASGNAVDALPEAFRPLPLLAVGAATAARARAAGAADVRSADGDARALTALAAASCDPGGSVLLLACGRGQGGALARELRARGFRVLRRTVYAASPSGRLAADTATLLRAGEIAGALFFSAETADAFVRVVLRSGLDRCLLATDAVAIGSAAGVALSCLSWRRIRVAAHPNQDAMLALLT